jgi:methionyl-tRNA formyltransferase
MKAVVFAYHNMGVIGISKLIQAGFEISLVFTYEENPNENIWFESVAGFCEKKSLKYVTPQTPNTLEWIETIKSSEPDIIFSFYYRSMLSKEILGIPARGAYNLHGSYLPFYRGRCPVNWVLIKGERYTGVTLHEMVEKPDAGEIVSQQKVEIVEEDTALTLFQKLEKAAEAMLADVLPRMIRGGFPKVPQDLSRGSYYGGRKPEDGRISWKVSASEIYNLIRGVTRPYPGAFCYLGEKKIIIWWGLPQVEEPTDLGRINIVDSQVLIGACRGSIELVDVDIDGSTLRKKSLLNFFKQYEGEYLL